MRFNSYKFSNIRTAKALDCFTEFYILLAKSDLDVTLLRSS